MFLHRLVPLLFMGLVLPVLSAHAGNNVSNQANKVGVKQCLPALSAISTFIISDAQYGSHDAWDQENPNEQIYTSTIERNGNEGVSVTNVTVAPVTDGDCSVVYDQINWFATSCLVVAKEEFANYIYKGLLSKKVVRLEGPATVYLLPAGEGCISLKKEVLINANVPQTKSKK